MKLKLKKQKISSLCISHKLMGGNTYTEPVKETEVPTYNDACMETRNAVCTYSVVPTKCDTNDGTLKTWEDRTGFYNTETRRC
ncbi:hypothetical protein [uncultured Kordia sp.]|uniref:hypothetical protein n=1 Tax=uncultured Kordia sp. TaxID=507699 RepID=UPI002614AF6F|nr:hypothetical protein [uncultured Kordia sp.]